MVIRGGPETLFNQFDSGKFFKYDHTDNGTHITGKGPIWYAENLISYGLKVGANSYVVTPIG